MARYRQIAVILFFSLLPGCGPEKDPATTATQQRTERAREPNPKYPVDQDGKGSPTADEAKAALLECLEKKTFENEVRKYPDGDLFLRSFSVKDSIQKVKNSDIKTDKDGSVFVGDWWCNLSERRFHGPGVVFKGLFLSLEGHFKPVAEGKWKAVLLGTSHGHLKEP